MPVQFYYSVREFIESAIDKRTSYGKKSTAPTLERLNDLLASTLDQLVYPMAGNMGLFYRHKSPAGPVPILVVEQGQYRLGWPPVKASSSSWLQYWNKHEVSTPQSLRDFPLTGSQKLRDATFCPAFLVTICINFGLSICVSGAILTTSPTIVLLNEIPLTSGVRLFPYSPLKPSTSEVMDVARFLLALREACALLSYYYRDFEASTERTARFFPLATQFDRSLENGDETPISFDYVDLLKRSTACTTVFLARERVSHKLVEVRFPYKYGLQAHTALAGLGRAPKLLYSGRAWHEHEPDSPYNLVCGGQTMIVTEHIEGISAADIRPGEVEGDSAKAELVRAAVLDAIGHLHKEKLVHGNIGLSNIIVADGEGDVGSRVKILDFDLAGVSGTARYPYGDPSIPGLRAPGAEQVGFIMEEHDLYLARHLYELE